MNLKDVDEKKKKFKVCHILDDEVSSNCFCMYDKVKFLSKEFVILIRKLQINIIVTFFER
jgi:hypothetical protein